MNTQPAALRQSTSYASDAFVYSLPGGFSKAAPWGTRATGNASKATAAVVEPDGDRTLIVTDIACDLPIHWLAQPGVVTLPMRLRFDSRTRRDDGDVTAACEFFQRDLPNITADAQVLPHSATGTHDFIHERLLDRTDFVLDVSLASSRGNAYMNSLTAAQNLMLQHGRARRQAGNTRPFKMWVIDSTTALNGQGVLVAECLRALKDGTSAPRVVQHVDALRKQVHTLAVPSDVSFFHRRNRVEGDAALGWLGYGVGRVLDRTPIVHANANGMTVAAQTRGADAAITRVLAVTTERVRAGLLAPSVCLSYAGNVAEVRRWSAFTALEDACVRHRVDLHLGTMSMTNALTMGVEGLAVSFASETLEL
jgi:fatty acid-binding protein DegV